MNPLPLVDAAEAPVPPRAQRLVLRELDLERQLAELCLALLGPRVPVRTSVASMAPDPRKAKEGAGDRFFPRDARFVLGPDGGLREPRGPAPTQLSAKRSRGGRGRPRGRAEANSHSSK